MLLKALVKGNYKGYESLQGVDCRLLFSRTLQGFETLGGLNIVEDLTFNCIIQKHTILLN
jgi:hypothetical protein